jgi:hypothetical protein
MAFALSLRICYNPQPVRAERVSVRDITARQWRKTVRFDPKDGEQVARRAAALVANGCH